MTRKVPHPRTFISEHVAEQLCNTGYDAENLKMLHEKQWSAIRGQNWLNMYVPQRFGGLGMSLPEIIKIEEGISWADGSSGWVVTLCSGAAWFVGFLDPVVSSGIFRSPDVCFAGSGGINGTADRTSKGYGINGFWPYATGSLYATVFTANCLIQEKGKQIYNEDGIPLVKSFLLMPDEVKIHRTWHAMGMVATGSHSIEVKSAIVPENRCFVIDADHAVLPDAIFRYPFLQLAESTLTANLLGMAIRFLDLAEIKVSGSSHGPFTDLIEENRAQLQDARQKFYHATEASWSSLAVGQYVPDALLTRVTVASRDLIKCCSEVFTDLYPLCGLQAADTRQEINRVWRNFHTAIQHGLFREFRLQAQRHD